MRDVQSVLHRNNPLWIMRSSLTRLRVSLQQRISIIVYTENDPTPIRFLKKNLKLFVFVCRYIHKYLVYVCMFLHIRNSLVKTFLRILYKIKRFGATAYIHAYVIIFLISII